MSMATGCGIAAAIGFLILGGVTYCGYTVYTSIRKEMPLVEGEVTAWIGDYNSNNFSDMYKRSDPMMTSSSTEEAFAGKMAKLKDQFGEVKLGSQTGFNMRTFNGDTSVVCQYGAANDKGDRVAIFTLHRAGAWKMSGFQIQQKF